MQLSRTFGGCTNLIHGREFPTNTIILRLDNGIELVCTNFRQSRKKPLRVYCYIQTEKRWAITFLKGSKKEIMWDYYRKNKKNKSTNYAHIAHMMKHDRKHKTGGSGIRLDKENYYADKTVTDYECRGKSLNDFPRVH